MTVKKICYMCVMMLMVQPVMGTSKNPNSVAMLRCSKNFNAYISNTCGALKFFSRLA